LTRSWPSKSAALAGHADHLVSRPPVGWPEFVATVEGVVAALPVDERARAVILTNDYSEASPLVLLVHRPARIVAHALAGLADHLVVGRQSSA
jgi:hypothetical protein